jgi:hypothetical protein
MNMPRFVFSFVRVSPSDVRFVHALKNSQLTSGNVAIISETVH